MQPASIEVGKGYTMVRHGHRDPQPITEPCKISETAGFGQVGPISEPSQAVFPLKLQLNPLQLGTLRGSAMPPWTTLCSFALPHAVPRGHFSRLGHPEKSGQDRSYRSRDPLFDSQYSKDECLSHKCRPSARKYGTPQHVKVAQLSNIKS